MILLFLLLQIGNSLGIAVGFLMLALLLLCSASVSASEIAYFSLSTIHLEELKQSRSPSAQLVIQQLANPKKLLATILIANNFINVGIVILAAFLSSSVADFSLHPLLGFIIDVIVITSLILIIGEIIPKIFASRKAFTIVLTMARPMQALMVLFAPLSLLLTSATGFIDRSLARRTNTISMDDLSDAIDITADGSTNDEDRRIMKSITRFGNISAREVMTPRVFVTAIEQEQLLAEVLKTIIDSGYSRIPVYNNTPDKVTGILYIKDLLPHMNEKEDFKWNALVRPAFFVPENKPINDLLDEFRQKKIHIAVVVDEYGGTSGIITMEDIIEEVMGDISDEFDTESDSIDFRKLDDTTYIFEGKTQLNDFCRIMEIEDPVFDEARGESDTLAGLILELCGKMPQVQERVTWRNFTFTVEAADRRRIKTVRVNLESDNAILQ